MFVIILLCSFLAQVNAGDGVVISVEEFLCSFGRKFKSAACFDRDFSCTPLHPQPTENLITIHSRKFGVGVRGVARASDLPTLRSQLIGEKSQELIRTFRVHDPSGILMRGDAFTPGLRPKGEILSGIEMYRATGGERTVGVYSYGDYKVCFKQWPEAPAIEVAAREVYKAIFPTLHGPIPIPASEVILMNGQVFLVSEFMEGESFNVFLERAKSDPTQYIFNLTRFQRLAIFCWLTVPEDCRPQNCFVRQIAGSNEHEIVLIDTERSFGREITEEHTHPERGNIHTRCHCVLFCFYELLSQKIREDVCIAKGDTAVAFMRVLDEDSYQRELFQRVSISGREKTLLGIPFNEGAALGMISRLSKFTELALSPADRSLASIFAEVSPQLAAIYKLPTAMPVTVTAIDLKALAERVYDIDAGRIATDAPASAYVPLELYFGSTKSGPELLNVLEITMRATRFFDEHKGSLSLFDAPGQKDGVAMIMKVVSSLISQTNIPLADQKELRSGLRGP